MFPQHLAGFYHRACWEEVQKDYGACAIYGCGSENAREVTSLAYVVRLARLLVAGMVLPPRAVRWVVRREPVTHRRGVVLLHGLVRGSTVALGLALVGSIAWKHFHDLPYLLALAFGILYPLALLIFGVVTFLWLIADFLPWLFGTVIPWILGGAVAALARADQPEGTVLGRLHRGGTDKK